MRKICFLGSIVCLLFCNGCQPALNLSTSQVSQMSTQEPGLYYSLPLTRIRITVQTTRTVFIPGPYVAFTSKYLGITSADTESFETWKISGITFDYPVVSDPGHMYCISWKGDKVPSLPLLKLSNEGLIMGYPSSVSSDGFIVRSADSIEGPVFRDVSYSDFFKDKTDTLYKTILQDSVFIKIPVIRKYTEQETLENKAKEAAHLIHKLRKRRIKMVSADYSVLPQGEAMEASLNELDRIEKEYLSLFLGKSITQSYIQSFWFTPMPDKSLEPVIARFSDSKGWIDSLKSEGQPLRVVVIPDSSSNALPVMESKESSGEGVIYYRIPGKADIRIFLGPDKLAQGTAVISQFGVVVPMRVGTN